ncbi:MAG: DUF5675 family protein [Desulfobacterales bacterium]
MIITIKRVSMLAHGVFGVLIDNDGCPFALTAERPWKNNATSVSCIPAGEYTCRRVQSPKFGNTFEVTNVEGRSHILFHKGNIPEKDSHGCILVGEQFEKLSGKNAVLSSKKGYGEFMDLTRGIDFFVLKIIEV